MDRQKLTLVDPIDSEQIFELVGYDFGLSRRGFIQVVAAGLLIAVATPTLDAQESGRGGRSRARSQPARLDARLHLDKDGTVTLFTGKVEGGQGARAEITQAAAQELHLSPDRVRLTMADTANVPDDWLTAGSRTTPQTIPAVRQACAAVRQLLTTYATKKGLSAEKVTYADLASDPDAATLLAQAPPSDAPVTPAADWNVMGQTLRRPNARDVLTGAHHYPRDTQRPGMLYGKVLRPASYHARLTAVDERAATKIPGALGIRDNDFVGVVAPTTYAAKKALLAVEGTARWEPRDDGQPSSENLATYLRAHTRDPIPANPFASDLSSATKTFKASYYIPYVQHVPMEPRAAVAEWSDDSHVTVWTSTQNPFGVRRELAEAFRIPESSVRVIVPDFGGGFGGKHTGECAVEAARLARSAGKPVSLQWTRAEEFTWAYFRPAGVMDVEASLVPDGALTSWHFLNLNSGPSGVDTPYRVPKSNCKHIPCDAPLRHGSYRALASTANHFARESAMDELAHLAGQDPLSFRLNHLDNPRLKAALQTAADKFGYAPRPATTRPTGRGVGLACGTEKGSCVAACAEVEVDRAKNTLRVLRVTQVFECGKIVNPDNLLSQNQGAIVQALGPVLREAMEFEAGRITNASLFDYKVPRVTDLPTIDVHLLDRPDLPSAGAGETPLICVAPAIANAVFNAVGLRARELPIRLA